MKQRATIKDLKAVGVSRVNFLACIWFSDFLEIRVSFDSNYERPDCLTHCVVFHRHNASYWYCRSLFW